MALNLEQWLDLDYDEEGDVLYAALGAPQPALSYEVEPDVLLRYIPWTDEIVGVTTLNFLKRFPLPPGAEFLAHTRATVSRLLHTYQKIPL